MSRDEGQIHLQTRRIVAGPVEWADPVIWTAPVSVGRYRVSPLEPGRSREEPAGDYAINRPVRGVTLRGRRGREQVLDGTRVALYARGDQSRFRQPTGTGTAGAYVRLDPDLARQLARAVDPELDGREDETWSRSGPLSAPCRRAWDALWLEAHTQPDPDALYEASIHLAELVLRELHRARVPVQRRDHRERVTAIQIHLATSPGTREGLDGLASRVGWTRFQLARAFRQRTGASVHRYREGLRLALARDRLQQGEPDLATLALELGYTSHSHFTARFTAATGLPPSAWRIAARI